MDKTLSATGFGMLTIVMLAIVTFLILTLFVNSPTGAYHVTPDKTNGTCVASVYQDFRFHVDREIYRGTPAQCWQLYWILAGMDVNKYKQADL